ncbi:MAG: hypothetical protein JWM68_4317 [Verrucomicrobiales bacterium]|nr:hypothetical protein [Verrucomicrobiales bacterium]
MKQDIAKTLVGISAGAVNAAKGLEDHEELDVKYCTLVVLNAARAMAFAAALLFNNAKLLLRTKRDALFDARDAVRLFATLLRDILKPIFGSEFNDRWVVVGFVDSLAIPTNPEQLLNLIQMMAAFLGANPAREVATLNITAVQAQALHESLVEAFADVTAQESVLEVLKVDRDAKYDALRTRLVQLVDELSYLMDPLDPRWKAFGFNKPGAQETPEVPVGVLAILIGATTAALKWNASARAEYYRVYRRIVGVDVDFVPAGSPADIDFNLENLPANSHVEIVVAAVNNGGESAFSEAVTIVTH